MKSLKAVLYTDGATSGNPGLSGSAYHGYLFDINEIGKKTSNKPKKNVMTSNGYVVGETADNLVTPLFYANGVYSHIKNETNNVAELYAIKMALLYCLNFNEDGYVLMDVLILSDSSYALSVFQKAMNDAIPSDISTPNLEYYYDFKALTDNLKSKSMNITFGKVKGHDDCLGNNIVDMLAVMARLSIENNIYLYNDSTLPASKYWSPHLERHPFLKNNNLYFTNEKFYDIQPSYSFLTYKTGDELGLRSSDPLFGTFIPSSPIKEIEDIKAVYYEYNQTQHLPLVCVDLNVLYDQTTTLYYKLLGNSVFNLDTRNLQLKVLNSNKIIYPIIPVSLPLKALDKLTDHRKVINAYKNKNDFLYNFINITDYFFEKVQKGKKIVYNCLLKQGAEKVSVTVNYEGKDIDIILYLGNDIPDRNKIKDLSVEEHEVILVTEKISNNCFEFFVIFHNLVNDDYSCWCNFYTNKRYTDILKGKK